MKELVFTKGYKLPIKHQASPTIETAIKTDYVALSLRDYSHLSFKVLVKEGDEIDLSKQLAYPKKYPHIYFCSPASGSISQINYGPKRVLENILIKLNHKELTNSNDFNNLSKQEVQDFLLNQGYWHLFKTFPKKEFAPLDLSLVKALHINAYHNEFFYPCNEVILKDKHKYLKAALDNFAKLIPTINIYTIKEENNYFANYSDKIPIINIPNKYPSELLGVQAFYQRSLEATQCVLGIDLQSVIEIGEHLVTGLRTTKRIYSVSGNGIKNPCHITADIGSSIKNIVSNNLHENNNLRFIAGGILQGKKVSLADFLMQKDNALQVFIEDEKRIALSFFRLGADKITLSNTWLSAWLSQEQEMSTNNNGEERACISCGYCIDVCPVKLLPNLLMKKAILNDAEELQKLSINDCVDCGLCTFVCPSKIEVLEHINKGREMMIKEGYYAV